MIITKIKGGLGNQMFQVASAFALAKYHNTKFKLDISFLRENDISTRTFTARKYELNAFDYNFNFASEKDIDFFFPRNKKISRRIIRKIKRTVFDPKIVVDASTADFYWGKTSKRTYLDGYWQSEKYFKDYRNDIINLFQFPKIKSGFESIANEILNSNSVSIHFRRGDYANKKYIKSVHGVCDSDYYKKAIKYFYAKAENIKLFLFSDEPDWVEEKFTTECEFNIVKTKSSTTDMQLMSLCKHNIIANSSFSWWGAWLNQNSEKIIVAPEKWFAIGEKNKLAKDLIPKKWKNL